MLRDIQTIKNIVKNETVNDNTWCLLGMQSEFTSVKSIKIPKNINYIIVYSGYNDTGADLTYNGSSSYFNQYYIHELDVVSFVGKISNIPVNNYIPLFAYYIGDYTNHDEYYNKQKYFSHRLNIDPASESGKIAHTCEGYLVYEGFDDNWYYFHINTGQHPSVIENFADIRDNFIKITGFIEKKTS